MIREDRRPAGGLLLLATCPPLVLGVVAFVVARALGLDTP